MKHEAGPVVGGLTTEYRPPEGQGEVAMLNTIKRFLREEDGPTATEYAVMLALVIVASIAAISALGSKVSSIFGQLNTTLDSVGAN